MARKAKTEVDETGRSRALSPFVDMERWFEENFRSPFSLLRPAWWPRIKGIELEDVSTSVDIFESGDNIVVKAELPGMTKKDIDINLTGDTLTISGEKKKEGKIEEKNFFRMERSYGSFRRSFSLPQEVQTDKAKAKFENGVLEVKIPKTEEAKKKEKHIPIE